MFAIVLRSPKREQNASSATFENSLGFSKEADRFSAYDSIQIKLPCLPLALTRR